MALDVDELQEVLTNKAVSHYEFRVYVYVRTHPGCSCEDIRRDIGGTRLSALHAITIIRKIGGVNLPYVLK